MEEQQIIENHESPEKQFSDWLASLPNYERVYYINKIALACDLSYQTVFKWGNELRRIRKPYIDIINSVADKTVIKI